MGAPTNYYIDPSAGSNTPSGGTTVGDPYLTTQFALDDVGNNHGGQDATNGDQFNILVGTNDVLSAALDISTYGGTPTNVAPLIFRGYSSAANDLPYGDHSNLGQLSGGGTTSIWNSTSFDYIKFIDMMLHNTGGNVIIIADDNLSVINCQISNASAEGVQADLNIDMNGCHLFNIGSIGVRANNGSITDSYFANGTNKFSAAIRHDSISALCIERNIITLGSSSVSDGIRASRGSSVVGNSILSPSGTGSGIVQDGTTNQITAVLSNLIDGFNVTTGRGIELAVGARIYNYDYNAVFQDSASNEYDINGDIVVGETDNETLGATPFAKSGADSFANRFIYFAPVAAVQGSGWPIGSGNFDKGAVQHTDAGGGGGLVGMAMLGGRQK